MRRWDLTTTPPAPEPQAPALSSAATEPSGEEPESPAPVQQVQDETRDFPLPVFLYTLGQARLDQINRTINRNIRRSSDLATFGRAEYWAIPTGPQARGDCEDYALAKRQALIDAGVPVEALSLAVVQTPRREMHAVLLVATPEGEVVLDNLTPWIVPWREAPYHWMQRQAPGSALTWVYPAITT